MQNPSKRWMRAGIFACISNCLGLFKVPAPVGDYKPDQAIAVDDGDSRGAETLYLVRDTKGVKDDLRSSKQHKTDCDQASVTKILGIDCCVVTEACELR